MKIRAGVYSAPELEFIANSGIGIELELSSFELELSSFELELSSFELELSSFELELSS